MPGAVPFQHPLGMADPLVQRRVRAGPGVPGRCGAGMGGRGVPAVRRGGVLGWPAAGGAARRGGQPVAERQPQAAYWFAVRGRPVLAGRCPRGRRRLARRGLARYCGLARQCVLAGPGGLGHMLAGMLPGGAAGHGGCDQAGTRRCAAGQGGRAAGWSAHRARRGAFGHPPCPIRTISSARNSRIEAVNWFTTYFLGARIRFRFIAVISEVGEPDFMSTVLYETHHNLTVRTGSLTQRSEIRTGKEETRPSRNRTAGPE